VRGKQRVGVTAGASAPEVLVQDVIARLREMGARRVTALPGTEENIVFPMPKGLGIPA
jgi:4-hydroxy-3-methylbut-2-enyl diphosphate reductase